MKRGHRRGVSVTFLLAGLLVLLPVPLVWATGPGDGLLRLEDLPEGFAPYQIPAAAPASPPGNTDTANAMPCGAGIPVGDRGTATIFYQHAGWGVLLAESVQYYRTTPTDVLATLQAAWADCRWEQQSPNGLTFTYRRQVDPDATVSDGAVVVRQTMTASSTSGVSEETVTEMVVIHRGRMVALVSLAPLSRTSAVEQDQIELLARLAIERLESVDR